MAGLRLVDEFAEALRVPIPEQLALLVARLVNPMLDPAPYLAQLDEMAHSVAGRLRDVPVGAERAAALVAAMRADLGFHGDLVRYYDAENSYLHHVLARRQGLPIMLSLVCLAIGRRLGLQMDGVGFPGHFMVQYREGGGRWYLDIFHGAVLPPDGVAGYLARVLGQPVRLTSAAFEPVAPQVLVLRMLNNLRVAYLGQEDVAMAAQVVELMTVLTPDALQLWWELGVLRYRAQELEEAARALRRYFHLQGHVALTFPSTVDSPAQIAPARSAEPTPSESSAWALLQEIETLRRRLN
jgi:regulator of sirC expression with transglutaminase-like and TPR domain